MVYLLMSEHDPVWGENADYNLGGKMSTGQDEKKENPFLIKTIITIVKSNAAGNEEKVKETVVFAVDQKSAEMPWYALRNFLVPRYLNDKHGPMGVSWQRIYQIRVIQMVFKADPNNISEIPLRVMTLEQLDLYQLRWKLNVNVFEFHSVEMARQMIQLREEDEEGFKKQIAEYREGAQRAYPQLDGARRATKVDVVDISEFDKLLEAKPILNREQAIKDKGSTPNGVVVPKDTLTDNPFASQLSDM